MKPVGKVDDPKGKDSKGQRDLRFGGVAVLFPCQC